MYRYLQPAGWGLLVHFHKNLHLQQRLLEKVTQALRPLMLLPGGNVEDAAVCLDSIADPHTVGDNLTEAPIVKVLVGEVTGADPPCLGPSEERVGIQSGCPLSIFHHHGKSKEMAVDALTFGRFRNVFDYRREQRREIWNGKLLIIII